MISRRVTKVVLVVALAAMPVLAGCGRKVQVESGTRVVCTYGHPISDSVKTIEVPADKAGSYRVRIVKRTCERHLGLEKLYAQAQTALSRDDTSTAQRKLAQVVAGDAAFRKAAAQLAAIGKGQTPDPDTDTSTPSTPTTGTTAPGEGDTSGPVGSLLKYAPDALDGFTAREALTDPNAITREYVPSGSSEGVVLVIVAEQERNAAVAKLMLAREVKRTYTRAGANVMVGGRSGYFGTDGSHYAAIGFTDGSVFVVLEMAAKQGVDPSKLKSELIEAASQLR